MKKPIIKSDKIALIYGILLGDGCLSKVGTTHYFISVVGGIKDDFEFLNEVVVPNLESLTNKKIKIRKRIKQRKLEILFTDRKLFEALNGIGFPIGKKGTKLKIPSFFNNKSFKHIIKGYFATDGSLVITNNNGIIYPRIEFSGISRQLLSQVLQHLTEKGMSGHLYTSKIYPNKKWNTLFRLQFNGKGNMK